MPIIPILQKQRPTTDAAAPVLDRERRPTIDTGEVQAGLRRVNEAGKMPLMDPQAMAAPWNAIAGLGEVIQKTGSVVAASAYKDREALGIKQYGEVRARWIAERAEFEKEKETLPPEEWEPAAARRYTRFQESLKTAKLTNEARANVENFLTIEGASFLSQVGDTARKTIRLGAASVLSADIEGAIEEQNPDKFEALVSKAEGGWYINAFEAKRLRQRFQEVGLAKANDAAENNFRSAVMLGDEKAMDAAIQQGKQTAQWSDEYAQAKRLDGLERIERNRQVEASRSEAEFLGEVLLRKADGETFTPAQVKAWATEGKVQKDTAARLMVALKSEQGAMTGELLDFLNTDVDSYDPRNDPDGLKFYELKKKAGALGLNPDQMSLFDMRLKRAADMKAPERAQKEVLVTGRKLIGEAFKDIGRTRTWDSDAEKLLADRAKLEALGVPAEKAEEISKLVKGTAPGVFSSGGKEVDKAKALTLFRQQAATRPAAKPEGLTEAEWSKFTALADGDVVVDPQKAAGAELDRAVLEEGLEAWYEFERKKRGTPPTEVEVKQWIGDKTRSVLQGIGARNLFQMPKASAGAAAGPVSLRGYTAAPDLSEKLPAPLAPYAATFEEAARRNGLNPYALAAIAMHETAGGTSKAFREKRNAMGISDATGPREMASVEDSINKMADILAGPRYAGAGGDLEQIGRIYAPPGAGNDPRGLNRFWPAGVAYHYRRLTE
jgi:hypothetical protein